MPFSAEQPHIFRVVVSAQNAAVNLRMERLHAAVHHFRKAGVFGDVADCEPEPFEILPRAAGAEEFDAAGHETASKHVEARFIADADQSPTDRRIHSHVQTPSPNERNASGDADGRPRNGL
jgi:hypothetical protein